MKAVIENIPGVLFLFLVGLVGRLIGEQIPYVSYLLVCIFIGILLSNTTKLPAFIEKGIKDTHKIWLESGIVVLGAGVLFDKILLIGPILLILVFFFVMFNILMIQMLSKHFGLDSRFGSVLASGSAVCGVSAVCATGGGLQVKAKDIAYAIAVVLIYDVVTVFLWPTIGLIFSMPSDIFGAWAGLTMMSTGTTVAAGFSHSDAAGELATIIKMVRNSTIGVIALLFTLYYANKGIVAEVINKKGYLWDKFPKFILGFVLLIALSNAGFFSEAQVTSMTNAYSWLFMMAFVGLGYDINLKDLKETGIKPLIITTCVFILVSVLSLVILSIIF